MRRRNSIYFGFTCALLVASTGSALALDTREVVVEKNEGIVEVPRHVAHVLSTPNRHFTFSISAEDASWKVLRDFERHGTFKERSSLLDHPDKLFHQITYFDFDEDKPIGAEFVAKRLMHQLGQMELQGLRFLVVGHADEAGSGTYNQALSLRRAQNIVALLKEGGYQSLEFEAIGRGKTELISFVNQSRNRRVELVVLGDKNAKRTFKKMRRGGTLTCRSCVQPLANTGVKAIGHEDHRQPSMASSPVEAKSPGAPTATIKALQQLTEATSSLGLNTEEVDDKHRADNPLANFNTQGVAPSLQEILSPQKKTTPDFNYENESY